MAIRRDRVAFSNTNGFNLKNEYSSNTENIACLQSSNVDNLKYVHNNAVCYNGCKTALKLKVATQIRCMFGDKNTC